MNQIGTLNTQGLLAMAAYAELHVAVPSSDAQKEALKAIGMTNDQAIAFTASWSVVDQYTDASGASATVFQENATGKRYLAIRR